MSDASLFNSLNMLKFGSTSLFDRPQEIYIHTYILTYTVPFFFFKVCALKYGTEKPLLYEIFLQNFCTGI